MMSLRSSLRQTVRFASVRRDLFGYEQSSEVGPWNAKISKVETWNEAGEILVEMNRDNCPPDESTFTESLKTIMRCPSKYPGGVEAGESKFCAMMDMLEEMDHRNGMKPTTEMWNIVLEATIEEGEYRAGRGLIACVEGLDAGLIQKVEKLVADAESAGTAFPAALSKQAESLFDIEIKAA